ncbi:Oidioi.mRNA.OKI2018_I69.PAR.g12732.t1.cds [Oikopleura dioica]|uniref:Oidioi.mRNA.OKI2018_I69.PAR.g12732.t1.cds n=1 Tax=Oikopleura dioica TaxID=34765 RepID=A0ABN7S6X4_OIKDI|nr:Oidioi.mRNA.OKI2018_I69.PAR.g12732.t1.cds [Oikopleura dioica]
MGKRKSAQRRNKKFKAADPFARGKSQANLGQKNRAARFEIIRQELKDDMNKNSDDALELALDSDEDASQHDRSSFEPFLQTKIAAEPGEDESDHEEFVKRNAEQPQKLGRKALLEKTHFCGECGAGFTRLGRMKAHIWKFHCDPDTMDKSKEAAMSICVFCGKDCGTPAATKEHVQMLHKNARINQRVGFKCAFCALHFRGYQQLTNHLMKTHKTRFNWVCKICGEKRISKESVEDHIEDEHGSATIGPQLETYECELCSYGFPEIRRFSSRAYFLAHVSQNHAGHPEVYKTICKIIVGGNHIEAEILEVDDPVEKIPAVPVQETAEDEEICLKEEDEGEKISVSKSRKKVFAEKKFFCEDCGAGFTERGGLRRHMKNIHGKALPHLRISSNPKHYPCPECNKMFARKWHMKRHARSVHCIFLGEQHVKEILEEDQPIDEMTPVLAQENSEDEEICLKEEDEEEEMAVKNERDETCFKQELQTCDEADIVPAPFLCELLPDSVKDEVVDEAMIKEEPKDEENNPVLTSFLPRKPSRPIPTLPIKPMPSLFNGPRKFSLKINYSSLKFKLPQKRNFQENASYENQDDDLSQKTAKEEVKEEYLIE